MNDWWNSSAAPKATPIAVATSAARRCGRGAASAHSAPITAHTEPWVSLSLHDHGPGGRSGIGCDDSQVTAAMTASAAAAAAARRHGGLSGKLPGDLSNGALTEIGSLALA